MLNKLEFDEDSAPLYLESNQIIPKVILAWTSENCPRIKLFLCFAEII